MKYPIISIKDNKVGFMPIQCDESEVSAIRGFSFSINRPDTIMNFSPNDYDLYKVGEFDTETGMINPCVPKQLVSGSSVKGDVN